MDKNYLILDTETTGTGASDEVLELGIIDMEKRTVYHSLFKPSCSIGDGAVAVHGITMREVEDAPRFSEEWSKIKEILNGKQVLIYNGDFDLRMLNQTARIHRCGEVLNKKAVHCVMRGYARHRGYGRWVKLEQALRNEGISVIQSHRAIGDCLMTWALIKKVGKIW